LDLYFLRMDTGYDAVMLAVMDEDGTYNVYRVDDQEGEMLCLFREKDPEMLRDHVRNWCRTHLPKDMEMVSIPISGGIETVEKLKAYLSNEQIPFERRQQTFYVSHREYPRVTEALENLI
jgi:hypothetical protein